MDRSDRLIAGMGLADRANKIARFRLDSRDARACHGVCRRNPPSTPPIAFMRRKLAGMG